MARLEEQLSLLITKMNQQGEQLEQLTSQQSERVESVVTKLKETDKHIDDIAGDLNSVKTEVHGRFGEMESSVTNLKVLQEELGERQKALKLTWDAYHTQFEMLAQINRWSDVDKAAYLAISLRGPAATVLTNLPPGQRQNYASLTSALQARFGTAHQTELNRMKLKGRTHRREETLPELAEDVERLVRLAYPDATEPMVEVLAKDQFVDSLPDEDMRLRIRQHRPATLRAALETALELESYQLASKQRTRFVKEIQLEEHPVQQVLQSSARGTVATGDVLQHLVDALGRCCKEFKTPTSTAAQKQTTRTNLVCWKCKQTGHRRAQCPLLQGNRPTQQQSENRVSQPGNEK